MIFESDFRQWGGHYYGEASFDGRLKSLEDDTLFAGSMVFSFDSRFVPARGNSDIFIHIRSNERGLLLNPPYGYSGNEQLVDFRILPNKRIVILAQSDSPELQVKVSNSRDLVNWIFMVDMQTGKVLAEHIFPYRESGMLGESNGDGDLTINYHSGLQLNLFMQHMLRVTTFSPKGNPYSVSRSDDLYDWLPLQEDLRTNIQWDIPMIDEKGFLRIKD